MFVQLICGPADVQTCPSMHRPYVPTFFWRGEEELNCKRREGFVSSHPKIKCLIRGTVSISRKFLRRNFDGRQLQFMACYTELCFQAKITIFTHPRGSRITGTNSFCIQHEFGEILYFPHKLWQSSVHSPTNLYFYLKKTD